MIKGGALTVSAAGVSDVFSAGYYADKYGDLKTAYGTDEAALLNHFITSGAKEGRVMSPISFLLLSLSLLEIVIFCEPSLLNPLHMSLQYHLSLYFASTFFAISEIFTSFDNVDKALIAQAGREGKEEE